MRYNGGMRDSEWDIEDTAIVGRRIANKWNRFHMGVESHERSLSHTRTFYSPSRLIAGEWNGYEMKNDVV